MNKLLFCMLKKKRHFLNIRSNVHFEETIKTQLYKKNTFIAYLLDTLPLAEEESVVIVLATFIPAGDNEDPPEVTVFIRCFRLVRADDDDDTATDAR